MTKVISGEKYGHLKLLVLAFCAWKSLLIALAAFTPGPGYDTSALILLDSSTRRHDNFGELSRTHQLVLNLFRWDALYFVKAAARSKLHEQEWAFSWAYSHLLKAIVDLVSGREDCPLQYYIVAGVVISNICHLCSVFVLYYLISLDVERAQSRQIALVASVLHVLTPAGLFMSAPYAEAPFSLLNFTGMFLYAQAKIRRQKVSSTVLNDVVMLLAGASFALACLFRSNGLLSGLIFLCDLIEQLLGLRSAEPRMQDCRCMLVTCVAGATIMLGFVLPQAIAFEEFCVETETQTSRPWCERAIPSIYSWVQDHYWNVGFFRYWTLPNLPLFVMASPMLWILVHSSLDVLRRGLDKLSHGRTVPPDRTTSHHNGSASGRYRLPELAAPQLVLALTALTTFHVQIVNRIASGYPTWYMILGTCVVDSRGSPSGSRFAQHSRWLVRGLIMYGIVQGMLYANFLPPA